MSNTGNEITTEQALCLSCGLCCDGALFGKVFLKTDDDPESLKEHGIETQEKDTKRSFKLPCFALENLCCQVYDDRPAACRKFRCELLKRYELGDVSREESNRIIARTRQLWETVRAEIGQVLPAGERLSIAAILKITPAHDLLKADPLLRREWQPTLLTLSALLEKLRTHFQPPPKNKAADIQANPDIS